MPVKKSYPGCILEIYYIIKYIMFDCQLWKLILGRDIVWEVVMTNSHVKAITENLKSYYLIGHWLEFVDVNHHILTLV